MAKISVIGAGTWGTGIARLLCNNGHSVIMWSPFPAEAESLRKTHIHPNLPNVTLPEELDFTYKRFCMILILQKTISINPTVSP